tara:strand:+ start:283 stop:561 length:279 start_codon:yes stop_codon:yes gene_type:complete
MGVLSRPDAFDANNDHDTWSNSGWVSDPLWEDPGGWDTFDDPDGWDADDAFDADFDADFNTWFAANNVNPDGLDADDAFNEYFNTWFAANNV